MRKIFLSLLIIFTTLFCCVPSQSKSFKDDYYKEYESKIPVYPNTQEYDLNKLLNIRMKAFITTDNFEKVVKFYTSSFIKKGWTLDFPKELEMKVWYEALNKDRTKTPNIMLVFSKLKDKISCNISIGVVKHTKYPKDLTLITVYLSDTMLE
jgi:hypothetical protein